MHILLLDGHNLLFRSFTSLPRTITGNDGQPIHALYGMIAAVLRMLREMNPDHVVAAFDVPETPTFRHELYPAYQAQRGPLGGEHADNFRRQVALSLEALPRIGIPALTSPGYEADDVIGTAATMASDMGGSVTIVSTDRDVLQLIRPGIEVLPPGSGSLRIGDTEAVRARIGVPPVAIPAFKALAGDPSDNIPGVRGIGPKGAADLVNRYGDLEGIYAHVGDVKARTARALEEQRSDAYLFRQLATIVTSLALSVSMDNLPALTVDSDSRAGAILTELGFRSS